MNWSIELKTEIKSLCCSQYHLDPNERALVLFQSSLIQFIQKFLQIALELSQYHSRYVIKARDITEALHLLSQRYFSVISLEEEEEEEGGEGGGEGEASDEKSENEDEEKEYSVTLIEEKEKKKVKESQSQSEMKYEVQEKEFSGLDDVILYLSDMESVFASFTMEPLHRISLRSYYHLLLQAWNERCPKEITIEAFEILYSILDHHMISNLERSSSLFETIVDGFAVPFPVICQLFQIQELEEIKAEERKCVEAIMIAAEEQRELNNLLKNLIFKTDSSAPLTPFPYLQDVSMTRSTSLEFHSPSDSPSLLSTSMKRKIHEIFTPQSPTRQTQNNRVMRPLRLNSPTVTGSDSLDPSKKTYFR